MLCSYSLVRRVMLSLVMGLAVSPIFAWGQQNAILTPDELVAGVLEHNAGLSARELRVKAKRALIDSAGALEDPSVSYSVAPATAGEAIASNFGNAVGIKQVLQFSQRFPWPGKLGLRTDLAQSEAKIEEYSYADLLLTLVSQSRSLWAQLWYLEQALETNAEHRELLEALEAVAETRYASGTGLQQDLLQIQTDLIDLEQQLIVLTQQRRRIQAGINDLLNRPPTENPGSPTNDLPMTDLPTREVLQGWMFDQQPELLALVAGSEAAYTQVQLEKKNDFPDIQLNVGYNELMRDSSLRFQVGVSINIPLDLGNKRSARKAAAGFAYSSSMADMARLKSQLNAELEQQLSSYDELMQNISLYETALIPRALDTFNAASANYEGGGGNFATLVDVQRQLLNLRLMLEQMQAEKIMVYSEIDRLSGGMVWPVEEIQ